VLDTINALFELIILFKDSHFELSNIWVVVFYEVLVINDIYRQMQCFYALQICECPDNRVD
jgi:hypothetical protein